MADGDASKPKAALFDSVFFTIVQSDTLGPESAAELREQLEEHGAVHCDLNSTQLQQITHIIADSPDFPAYEDACDGFIHVVRPSWVEHSIQKERHANTRQYRPDPRLILSEVVVAIADDIPIGDKDAIIGGLQAMGGQYSSIMTKLVTHVVALTMEAPQCRIIVDKKLDCKPVLPHWFDQCLMLGKRIDAAPYTLPDPPILNDEGVAEDLNDKTKYANNNQDLKGSMFLEPRLPAPVSPSKDRKNLTVFHCKKVKLADDLDLNQHLRETLRDLIEKSAGAVVSNLREADILICRFRQGLDFREALDKGKDVGSLNWLYHLINTNKYVAPTRKLLHFPIPKTPLPGFEQYQISVSNYTGEARVYLESLIRASGATFTKTMTQNNTHLITAHSMSEKVDAAREWNIATVNHLWLEESYARCKGQALTTQRYTTFPSRTNLGEVIGQTQLERKLLEEMYLPHRAQEAALPSPAKSVATAPSGSNKTPRPGKTTAVVTPAANDKENLTPGSRGAKDRAINKLHSMASDIEQFQKEMKRKGGVIFGGRRVTDPERVAPKPNLPRKRTSDQQSGVDSDDELAEATAKVDVTPKSKRKKTEKTSRPMTYVVTGGTQFQWTAAKSNAAKALGLREMGDVPQDGKVDVLVAPRVIRTEKFLAAIAAGASIVAPKWLQDSLKKEDKLDPVDFPLKDEAWEQENAMSLQNALKRAREHGKQGGMLRGTTVYCTENVSSGPDTVCAIVRRNGGECVGFKGREKRLEESAREDAFLVTVPRDKSMWGKFRILAEESDRNAKIVNSEWLLRIAMSQEVDEWDDGWEFKA